jgi:hypothetical protein
MESRLSIRDEHQPVNNKKKLNKQPFNFRPGKPEEEIECKFATRLKFKIRYELKLPACRIRKTDSKKIFLLAAVSF